MKSWLFLILFLAMLGCSSLAQDESKILRMKFTTVSGQSATVFVQGEKLGPTDRELEFDISAFRQPLFLDVVLTGPGMVPTLHTLEVKSTTSLWEPPPLKVLRTSQEVRLRVEPPPYKIERENKNGVREPVKEDRSAEAADILQQALELDRGDYLESSYDDWAITFRDSLRMQLSRGLSILADIRLKQGQFEETVTVCRHLLEKDPFDEKARQGLFQAQIDLGQPLQVVRDFEILEQKMRLELDLDPSMDLVKLYHIAKLKL